MDQSGADLRAALSRLLAAVGDLQPQDAAAKGELSAARELAAKALLVNRVRVGRPWVAEPGAASYFDQWRDVRSRGETLAG